MQGSNALTGIRVVFEAQNCRELYLFQHSSHQTVEEYDDVDCESPVFESFYLADGNEGILKLKGCLLENLDGCTASLVCTLLPTGTMDVDEKASSN